MLQNHNPKDYLSNIPPLIQRGVCESKHHFDFFKNFSSKRFGEDAYNFVIFGTMYQVNSLGLYMISNHVKLCVDVISSIMKYGILGQLDCKSIID
jgi:hypothetical protein